MNYNQKYIKYKKYLDLKYNLIGVKRKIFLLKKLLKN